MVHTADTIAGIAESAVERYLRDVSPGNSSLHDLGNFPIDVNRLAAFYGGVTAPACYCKGCVPARLRVERPGKFTVFLPAHTGGGRLTASIAHSLGHYFVHYPRQGGGEAFFPWGVPDSTEGKRLWWEANIFAENFLIPSATLTHAWETLSHDEWVLARLFDSFPATIARRLEEIGLVQREVVNSQ